MDKILSKTEKSFFHVLLNLQVDMRLTLFPKLQIAVEQFSSIRLRGKNYHFIFNIIHCN